MCLFGTHFPHKSAHRACCTRAAASNWLGQCNQARQHRSWSSKSAAKSSDTPRPRPQPVARSRPGGEIYELYLKPEYRASGWGRSCSKQHAQGSSAHGLNGLVVGRSRTIAAPWPFMPAQAGAMSPKASNCSKQRALKKVALSSGTELASDAALQLHPQPQPAIGLRPEDQPQG